MESDHGPPSYQDGVLPLNYTRIVVAGLLYLFLLISQVTPFPLSEEA